ncbi:MAG TPA: S41 family peptidase [Coriobacteriia bacterium]|jgi:carboxyl-terminal processing protease
MNRGVKITIVAMSALVIALAAFAGGVFVGRVVNPAANLPVISGPPASKADQLMDQVRAIIKREALRPSSDDSITANAISGMLKSLDDPYAAYFDTKHYQFFQEDTEGKFGGIGVTLSVQEGTATIVSILTSDSPAAKAGLKAGDQIYKIDGWRQPGWTSEQVVSRVRGKEGTRVTLTIRRKGVPDFDVKITRGKIVAPNILKEMVGKDVGYIRLLSFNAQATDDVRKTISEMDAKGAKGYVLDLRENPGGLLAQGVDVASLFIKEGPIVRVDQRGMPEDVENATGDSVTAKPLVVLIDGDSASASEILAGALQDYKRATLVGVKSFGKGSVQTVRELDNGGAIKLTIAHYLTPKGRSIDRKGLLPDVIVPMDPNKQADKKTDLQFQEAVRQLRALFK